MTNVRKYTDEELLNKVKSLDTFEYIPNNYWMIGVQSLEDETNVYDDKFYVYKGEKFIMTLTGTTNAGKNALTGYDKIGVSGAAVWKTNMIYYDMYSPGKHKGKMDAWRQVKPIYYYRDADKDGKAEEQGKLYHGIIYVNFHANNYDRKSMAIKKLIGGWSYGCQVSNDPDKYNKLMSMTKEQKYITYCLLKEF
jgi:hypothetical protein